jgi:hypothetical protein
MYDSLVLVKGKKAIADNVTLCEMHKVQFRIRLLFEVS